MPKDDIFVKLFVAKWLRVDAMNIQVPVVLQSFVFTIVAVFRKIASTVFPLFQHIFTLSLHFFHLTACPGNGEPMLLALHPLFAAWKMRVRRFARCS